MIVIAFSFFHQGWIPIKWLKPKKYKVGRSQLTKLTALNIPCTATYVPMSRRHHSAKTATSTCVLTAPATTQG